MNNFDFCGLPVTSIKILELKKEIISTIKTSQKKIIFGHSLGIFPRLIYQPEVLKYFSKYDIFVSDGFIFHKLGQFLNYPFKDFISIPQTVMMILRLANQHNFSLMLLGSKEETNLLACKKIKTQYKNIVVEKGHHGYFKKLDEKNIVKYINKVKPNILLIGMNSPTKERFAFDWKDRLDCNIIIPCGGMIDVIAGKTRKAPWFFKKIGLALLFRLIQEPKRLYRTAIYHSIFILFYFIPIILYNKLMKKKNIQLKDMNIYKNKFLKCVDLKKDS